MKKKIPEAERLGNEIRDSFERWNHIYAYGAGDPFWPDGTNLELLRNHIICYKNQCEDLLKPEQYPQEYYLELPPEVDRNYMAHPEIIREAARKSLEMYKADPDYVYLEKTVTKLTKLQKEKTGITAVLKYAYGLENAIRQDRIVDMRRHENPAGYIDSFRECRKRVEDILWTDDQEPALPMGQLSLFDLFGLT